MDQFDRGFRQRVAEKMATDEASGYGPAKRGRQGVGVGGALTFVGAIVLLLLVSDCASSDETEAASGHMTGVPPAVMLSLAVRSA
jgi:hypothetical protein